MKLKDEYECEELPEPCITSIDFALQVGMDENNGQILEVFKFLRNIGAGEIFTQVDSGAIDHPGVLYSRGIRFVNRTGVYAFVFGNFAPKIKSK